jgi:hypothetical protein
MWLRTRAGRPAWLPPTFAAFRDLWGNASRAAGPGRRSCGILRLVGYRWHRRPGCGWMSPAHQAPRRRIRRLARSLRLWPDRCPSQWDATVVVGLARGGCAFSPARTPASSAWRRECIAVLSLMRVGRDARIGSGDNSPLTCDHKKMSWPVGRVGQWSRRRCALCLGRGPVGLLASCLGICGHGECSDLGPG